MRGRRLAVTGLVLMVGSLSLLFLLRPPLATAQSLAPEITSAAVTCKPHPTAGKYVEYAMKIKNVNAAGTPDIVYTVVRSWSDGRPNDNKDSKAVPPGGSADVNLLDQAPASVGAPWTYTAVVKVGGAEGTTVAGPFTSANPCFGPPEVTYEVTCQRNSAGEPQAVVYAPTIKNPNTVPVAYTLVRTWSDGRPEVPKDAEVAPGATASGDSVNHTDTTALTAQWTHTLTIKVGDTEVGTPITKQNPCSAAQTDPPEVTFDVTCQKTEAGAAEDILYALSIKNPNPVAQTYKLVLSWSDDREDVTKDVDVDAGATMAGDSVDYTNNTGLTAEWTTTLTVMVGDTAVGEPITKQNPCYTAPPGDDPPADDPTTTPSNAVAAATSGSGLASTGVGIAVSVIAGVGLLLFANGAGLLRLVRRGEHE